MQGMARVTRKTCLNPNGEGPPASSKRKRGSKAKKGEKEGLESKHGTQSKNVPDESRGTALSSRPVNVRGGWRHPRELAPAASELRIIQKAREMGRNALPEAVQVVVSGLRHDEVWVRMTAARMLMDKFGLPTMAQLKQTVEVAAAPRRLYGFQDPFIEAGVVEADFEQLPEGDTTAKVSNSSQDDDDGTTT